MAKCSCCGRKKKFLESFEDIGKGGAVCVECSDLLYRIHDAKSEKNVAEYNQRVNDVKKYIGQGKVSNEFKEWFINDFLKRNSI